MWRTAFFVHLLATVIAGSPLSISENVKVCNTHECRLAASLIKAAMNKSANPCENFYNYACGGWEENFPQPAKEDVWNLDKLTEHHIKAKVKEILEEDMKDDDTVPLKCEKLLYKSCMDEEKIEEAGLKPVQEILDLLDGWPITMEKSDWSDDGHKWQSIHGFYTGFKDLSALYFIHLATNYENPRKFMIEVAKPTETLYQNLMKRDDTEDALNRYEELMKTVVSAFINVANKAISSEEIAKDINNILAFEKNLHQIRDLAKESNDLEPTRALMTIEEMQEFYDEEKLNSTAKINWLEAIRTPFKELDQITIESTEKIGIKDKIYLRTLSYLLNETPNHVIVNYIHWRFIVSSLKYLNKEIRDLYREISTKPEDLDKVPERWEGEEMAIEVRGELLDEVEHSNWLDDNTKEETRTKLHDLKWFMGASYVMSSRLYIEHVYDGFAISLDYFRNIQNVRKFLVNHALSPLRRRRWTGRKIDPLQAKVFYDPSLQMLVVLAAELSVPLLNPELPRSIHYGYLAPTMAHLIAKTMEKQVSRKTYVAPWSTVLKDTYLSYQTKTQCMKRQYQDYLVGPFTVDENMYDAIGLQVAYNALQNSADRKEDEKLPDLEDLSENQLFFLTFATKYCQSASAKYLSKHDPAFHTPNEYRVIGPLSNFEYFAKAFNCPSDSFMNPDNKCVL